MKANITRTQIDRLCFFLNLKSSQTELSNGVMKLLNDLISSFKVEMNNPTMNGEELFEVWELINSFSTFDFSINNYSKKNKIKDILRELVDTKGFIIMVDFINNRAIEYGGGYYSTYVRDLYSFFKYSRNTKQGVYLYKGHFETLNMKLGYKMQEANSIILYSENEEFLLKHYDEIFPAFRVESKNEFFSKNVFDIINKVKIFKEAKEPFRTNECARMILKYTDSNSVYLNNKQFSKLIDLYKIYGKKTETISELLRVVDLEEIKKRLTKNNVLIRNKELCLNSKEKTLAIENILSIKVENAIDEDGVVLVNFNFEDQLWIIDLAGHDTDRTKVILSFIKDNNLYINNNNTLNIDQENKELLELNFKY